MFILTTLLSTVNMCYWSTLPGQMLPSCNTNNSQFYYLYIFMLVLRRELITKINQFISTNCNIPILCFHLRTGMHILLVYLRMWYSGLKCASMLNTNAIADFGAVKIPNMLLELGIYTSHNTCYMNGGALSRKIRIDKLWPYGLICVNVCFIKPNALTWNTPTHIMFHLLNGF